MNPGKILIALTSALILTIATAGAQSGPGSTSGDPAKSSAKRAPPAANPSGSGPSGSGGKDDNADGGVKDVAPSSTVKNSPPRRDPSR